MLLDFLPKAFLCVGCNFPSWKTVCDACKNSILTNSKIIPLPINEVEGVAPLLYSFERTQALIRHWKEGGSTDLRRVLFRMPENLRRSLLELHFFAIVPIPQDRKRSYRRSQESSFEVARFFSKELKIPLFRLLELKDAKSFQLTGLTRFNREFAANPFQINPRFPKNDPLSRLMDEKHFQESEMRLLLVDDLITSGSTLAKAGETLIEFFPHTKIWAGSLGFRPKLGLNLNQKDSTSAQASRALQYLE